ncbi:MAG: aminotransferase class IV, partial [Alphaproteobacteria bacterium]|nr:aminotransferase class IV [Alphaproteobacteria bacterium]
MLVYLNDRFVPAGEASVSVQDRGFRFGDGVFETIALRRGEPYQWAFHMQRLEAGLAALRISFNTAPLLGICTELLARNGAESGLLRIAVSRGVGSQGYLPLSGN